MSSNHVEPLLTPYLDEQITKKDKEKVKSHMIFCMPCRNFLNDIQNQVSQLQKTPTRKLPDDLLPKVVASLKASETSPPAGVTATANQPLFAISRTPLIIGGIALLAVIALWRGFSPQADKPELSTGIPSYNKEQGASAEKTQESNLDKSTIFDDKRLAINEYDEKPPEIEPFSELSGVVSGIGEPLEKVVSTERAWKKLWKKHVKNVDPKPSLPLVNFDENQILAVFSGAPGIGGTALKLVEIEQTTWEGRPARLVKYRIKGSDPQKIGITLATHPFLLKAIPRQQGRIFFRRLP